MLPQSNTERLLETHLKLLAVQVEAQIELTQFEACHRVSADHRHAAVVGSLSPAPNTRYAEPDPRVQPQERFT